MMKLTQSSRQLFEQIVKDLTNWSGASPCFNYITAQGRGNLTDLKRKGLVTTFKVEGEEWIKLTQAGKELAEKIYGCDAT